MTALHAQLGGACCHWCGRVKANQRGWNLCHTCDQVENT